MTKNQHIFYFELIKRHKEILSESDDTQKVDSNNKITYQIHKLLSQVHYYFLTT